MRRVLIYAALALAVFSLTYCTNNRGIENIDTTTTVNTNGSNKATEPDTIGTFPSGTGMDTTTTNVGTGTGTSTPPTNTDNQ